MRNQSPRPTRKLPASACSLLTELLADKHPTPRPAVPERVTLPPTILADLAAAARQDIIWAEIGRKIAALDDLADCLTVLKSLLAEVRR